MDALPFSKVHGLGNDFVLIDCLDHPSRGDRIGSTQAKRICDRHRGVGADGVVLVLPAQQPGHQAKMVILNADGSRAQMCGNVLRCVARFLRDRVPDLGHLEQLTIETDAGALRCDLHLPAGPTPNAVGVDMGAPRLDRELMPMRGRGRLVGQPFTVDNTTLTVTAVSMGNPHLITFVEDGRDLEAMARELGPQVEHHPDFPQRTNAEFARTSAGQRIELWVWERGCGITQACGTGACATAVAAVLLGRCPAEQPIAVTLPGGDLSITVRADLGGVHMIGPTEQVFTGTLAPGIVR